MAKFINLGEKKVNITLLGVNISEYAILLAAGDVDNLAPYTLESKSSHVKVAKDLQKYIYLLTDISIPIVYDNYNMVHKYEIRIGETKRTATKDDSLGDEGYIIKSIDNRHVEIVGGLRGVLYGVYSFIEKYFGVRYFTPIVEKVLDNGDIKIDEIDEKFIPHLEYRDVMFCEAWDKNFSVKQKINGLFCRQLGEEEGYGVGYAGGFDGICHTFAPLVPKDKYFKDHPEYYALRDGVRNPDGLCLANKEMFNVFVENLKKWLRAEKEPRLVSVSPNDNHLFCQCPECAAIDEREGSHSGQVLDFVNRVANAIKDEFPLVKIDMMSYCFARKAPKYLMARENVAIRCCTSVSCSNHKIGECKEKTHIWNGDSWFSTDQFMQDLTDWGKMTDKVYIWDYVINFYHLPSICPNFDTFMSRIRYYLKNKMRGIYYEGSSDTGEFYELRIYLHAKTAWNPFMSDEEFNTHFNEFIDGYYGGGAEYIKEFISYSKEYLKDMHFGTFSPLRFIFPKEEIDGKTVYSIEYFKKCKEIFNKAIDACTSIGDKERCKKASIQVDYCDLFLNMDYYMSVASEEEKANIILRNKTLYENMIKYNSIRIIENEEMVEIKDFTLAPYHWTLGHEEQQTELVGVL